MEQERRLCFISQCSHDAMKRLIFFMATIGISVLASIFDKNSCYATAIVLGIENIEDFFPTSDNKKYVKKISRMSKVTVFFSIIAMLYAFCGLTGMTFFNISLEPISSRLICIGMVVIPPTMILYHDYISNAKIEDGN